METPAIVEDAERRGAERSEAPRSGEASTIERAATPDTQVLAKATRRRFTSEFKLQVLHEADQCGAGELGALLRRHGLYSSHLSVWRRERDLGARERLSKKRGRKASERNPLSPRVVQLEKENLRLQARLKKAELLLDIQKKVSMILGIPLNHPESGDDE
jgi:transposase